MSSPINAILTGTYTTAATPVAINLSIPSEYTKITLYNITDMGSAAANTNIMQAYATSSMAAGSGVYVPKTNGAATLGTPVTLAANANGFTFVHDSASSNLGAALTVTSTTNAAPPVVSMASTAGLNNSDVVRYVNSAGQLNISGMDFTINTVVANTSVNLAYMGAPGGAGTGGTIRRVPFDPRFYPPYRFVTAITQAASAVITLSVTHQYTVGQEVRIIVPSAFGMIEMNNLLGVITAINTTTNTITVDIDSSGFTAFAFPTSAIAALGVSFALVVPVGEAAINSSSQAFGNLLDDATRNTSFSGVIIGTAVQTASKLYQWVAEKGITI
jgi:hypothetical protein